MLITELTQRLQEFFLMSYSAWGWMLPGGVIKMANPAQAKDHKSWIHTTMARDLGKSGYDAAFKAGWIRWYVEDNTLWLNTWVWKPTHVATISKGIKNIEKIVSDPKKIRHFGPDDEVVILKYIFELESPEAYVYAEANTVSALLVKIKREVAKKA